jgi:hypothetical protein
MPQSRMFAASLWLLLDIEPSQADTGTHISRFEILEMTYGINKTVEISFTF